MIAKLAKRMEAQDMGLRLTDGTQLLADVGFDPVLGARPLLSRDSARSRTR